MRRWRPIFTNRQTLLLGSAVLLAVLLVAGSYFRCHWFYGPDVEPVPEHLLSDKSRSVSMNRPVAASFSQDTMSVSADESFSGIVSTIDPEETLSSEELAALSDEELTALAEAISALEQESSDATAVGDFPEVSDGYPSDIRPVWLEDYFDGNLHADHVLIDRVLIELWNQGDHDFVNGILDENTGRVYPIYHNVVYVEWDSHVREGSNGESIRHLSKIDLSGFIVIVML